MRFYKVYFGTVDSSGNDDGLGTPLRAAQDIDSAAKRERK